VRRQPRGATANAFEIGDARFDFDVARQLVDSLQEVLTAR
jgi:hypothetical protein